MFNSKPQPQQVHEPEIYHETAVNNTSPNLQNILKRYCFRVDYYGDGSPRLNRYGKKLLLNFLTETEYDWEGYDSYGFNKEGVNRSGFKLENYLGHLNNHYHFDHYSINKYPVYYYKGYDSRGFDKNGFDIHGYDMLGFDRKGKHKITKGRFSPDGFDMDGISKITGLREEHLSHYFIHETYSARGFNSYDGMNKNGTEYDKQGYNINYFDKNGINKFTGKEYNEYGWDKGMRIVHCVNKSLIGCTIVGLTKINMKDLWKLTTYVINNKINYIKLKNFKIQAAV